MKYSKHACLNLRKMYVIPIDHNSLINGKNFPKKINGKNFFRKIKCKKHYFALQIVKAVD